MGICQGVTRSKCQGVLIVSQLSSCAAATVTHDQAMTEVFELERTPGCTSPATEACASPRDEGDTTPVANVDISDIARRAIAEVQLEEDVCSICLEDFTEEDPATATSCK
jgi:hypothetical protein